MAIYQTLALRVGAQQLVSFDGLSKTSSLDLILFLSRPCDGSDVQGLAAIRLAPKTGRLRVMITRDGQGDLAFQAFKLRESDHIPKDNLLPENFCRAVVDCAASGPSFDPD